MENEIYSKDFDPSEHVSCQVCQSEVLYVDTLTRKICNVLHDGTLDLETMVKDDYVKDSDVSGLICNNSECNAEIKPYLGLRWRLWCPCCQQNHGFTKKLRKSSDLEGNAVKFDEEKQRVHVLCDSCISIYTWTQL